MIAEAPAPLDFASLQAHHVRRFIGQLHARGLAGRSLARILSAWRGFYRWLGSRGAAKINPAEGIRAPKSPRPLPKVLSPDEANRLLEPAGCDDSAVGARDQAMFELFYSSGLRLAELAALDVDCLPDVAGGEVRVLGKRSKLRVVPVGSRAREALARWAARRVELAAADEGALFVGTRGRRINHRVIEERLRLRALAQGLPIDRRAEQAEEDDARDALPGCRGEVEQAAFRERCGGQQQIAREAAAEGHRERREAPRAVAREQRISRPRQRRADEQPFAEAELAREQPRRVTGGDDQQAAVHGQENAERLDARHRDTEQQPVGQRDDLTDTVLLEKHKSLKKPIFISTGMSEIDEIDKAVEILGKKEILIAQATSTYPCSLEELNLNAISTFKKRYPDVPIGYSGHETGLAPTYAAVALGANFIERHITLDRALWGTDQASSVEVLGMFRLVKDIRDIEKSFGDGVKKIYQSELASKTKLRKHIYYNNQQTT